MIVLRCTKRLGARLPRPLPWESTSSDGILGDWYADLLRAPGKRLALCTNGRTLLSVVLPVAPTRYFIGYFREAALKRIQQLPVPAPVRTAESRHFAQLNIGPTRSPSVLGSMNQLAAAATLWLLERPAGDLEQLGLWLCDTPMPALDTHWPWKEAVLLLTGVRPPDISRLGPSYDAT